MYNTRVHRRPGFLTFAAVILTAAALSCSRDVRLTGRKIPTVAVRTVTHYGITLDQPGTPEQVAYVALQAIRDDFSADTESNREAALAKQFDVCAATWLDDHNRTSQSRDEYVYSVVYRWTPTVSHYIADFPRDWEAASDRLVQRSITRANAKENGGPECEVAMQVADPNGDPTATAVLVVWLAKDSGFWRVIHLGFDSTTRTLAVKAP